MHTRIIRNSAAQLASLALTFLDRFVIVGTLLRVWGPGPYSDWTTLLSCAGLIVMGEMGLNIYYGNSLQSAWLKNDAAKFQRIVSIALYLSGAIAILLGMLTICVGLTRNLITDLAIRAMPPDEAYSVFALLALAVLSRIARGSISQIFRGRQQFATGILVDLMPSASTVVLTLIAAVMGAPPLVIAGLILLSDLIAGWAFMIVVLWRRYPDLNLIPAMPTRAELADVGSHVKWLAIYQGAPVAWLQLPVAYLSAIGWGGPPLVSFVLARTLINFMRTLGNMLSIGSGVETAALQHAGDHTEVPRHIYMTSTWLAIITTFMASGLILFGEPFVALWSGRPDLYNANVIVFLAISTVICAPSTAIASHLMLANEPRLYALALIVQIVVGIAAFAVGGYLNGPTGAAAGLAFAEIFSLGLLAPLMTARVLNGFEHTTYFRHCLRAIGLTGLSTMSIGYLINQLMSIQSAVELAFAVLMWAIISMVVVCFTSLSNTQRKFLLGLWKNYTKKTRP